jgi:hypothetical protein
VEYDGKGCAETAISVLLSYHLTMRNKGGEKVGKGKEEEEVLLRRIV